MDHDDRPATVDLVAAETPLYGLQFEATWRDDVLVLGWAAFWWDLRDRLEAAMRDARGARGVVLDLRGNSGGLLVTDLVSCSVSSPCPLGRYIYHQRDIVPMAGGRRDPYVGKVAVLVDERSASSAEILARCCASWAVRASSGGGPQPPCSRPPSSCCPTAARRSS